jgi:hypothetical protein
MKNLKSLLFPHWQNSRISKIKHIWDTEEKIWVKEKNIIEQLESKHNWLIEYLCIKNSIPKKWKETLQEKTNPIPSNQKRSLNVPYSTEQIHEY